MEFKLRVPASMSNLGAGFDTFGLAVSLYNYFYIKSSDEFKITFHNIDIRDEDNLVLKVYKYCIDAFKKDIIPTHIHIVPEIPFSRGLGSSSSAIIGAIKIFEKVYDLHLDIQQILKIAYIFEPHPDNLVPALVGGFNVCLKDGDNTYFNTLNFPTELKIIALIPEIKIDTQKARDILPKEIPLKDAVLNIQRSNLFLSSILLKRFELLREGVKDKIHQPYRKSLIPYYDDLEKIAYEEEALAVFISGSGSTIGILTLKENEIGHKLVSFLKGKNIEASYKVLSVDQEGAKVWT